MSSSVCCLSARPSLALTQAAPGDCFFGGAYWWAYFAAWLIRLGTGGPTSHVEMVLRRTSKGDAELWSARKDGVHPKALSTFLGEYHHTGRVWWVRLSYEARRRMDLPAMLDFAESIRGKDYDLAGALGSAAAWENSRTDKSYFCSKVVAALFQAGRILTPGLIPDEVHPYDMAKVRLWDPTYFQVLGLRQEIPAFNTVPVSLFAESVL